MSAVLRKKPFPVAEVRRLLEPGPVVLVSSAYSGRNNVMTMAWHSVMEFSPSLVGCVISASNHSFEMVRRSLECVINIPTSAMLEEVIGIGTCSGADVDKFERFGLATDPAEIVAAPLIRACYANLECRLADDSLVDKYNFFIWEVVSARAAISPRHPETLHYKGDGVFMASGRIIHRHRAGLL